MKRWYEKAENSKFTIIGELVDAYDNGFFEHPDKLEHMKVVMNKALGAEALFMVLRGRRAHYPSGNGTIVPDVVDRYGTLCQCKAQLGGFNVLPGDSIHDVINRDAATHFFFTASSKHGVHYNFLTKQSLHHVVAVYPTFFRLSGNRYRIVNGMKRSVTLNRFSKMHGVIENQDIEQVFDQMIGKIRRSRIFKSFPETIFFTEQ